MFYSRSNTDNKKTIIMKTLNILINQVLYLKNNLKSFLSFINYALRISKTTFIILLLFTTLSKGYSAGFSVNGSNIIDANGNNFIMKGVNLPYTWFKSQSIDALPVIASYGANTVRVVLSNGQQWGAVSADEVQQIISICKQNNLIAVLEIHDCTGSYAPLSSAVDYWLSEGIRNAITGQEAYVIINIANEPFDNNATAETWREEHITAIKALRDGGLTHLLMVDAANWGQDWQFIMYNNAETVFSADPLSNIMFSVHMYEVFNTYDKVNSYLSHFKNTLQLPLVVGEFAADHKGQFVDAESIFERTAHYQQGYLGWSWTGNDPSYGDLDMVNNNDWSTLTNWGTRIIFGQNGWHTAKTASVFENPNEQPPSNGNKYGFLLFEAEEASLINSTVNNQLIGYSGSGYVDAATFTNSSSIVWNVNLPATISYELIIGYNIPQGWGDKTNTININGTSIEQSFAENNSWSETSIGFFNLNQGANTIELRGNWGWMNTDYLKISGIALSTNEERILQHNTSVFPNPVTDGIINISNSSNLHSFVNIFDLAGNLLLNQKVTNNTSAINISGINPGVYIIQIINESSINSKKIIVR
jgi:mannan endo-1,4-beta-mannosidase